MTMNEEPEYDVVIIGSGLGGLACGVIFAKEGQRVCILERNKQIGGTLQTFSRDKVIFDSGVHYVGGLGEGQNLNQLFRYFGIMDKMKIKKLDEDMYDALQLKDDPTVYKHAQGYENFIKTLAEHFPEEEENLRKYCDAIREVCDSFPLYNLKAEGALGKKGLSIDVTSFIESITPNKKLRSILGGTNMLYAGEEYRTPLYVHALIMNSYIEGSWRFVDGGSQIAKHLAREITSRGGVIIKRAHVNKIKEEGGVVSYVSTTDGRKFRGKYYISNLHPRTTMDITESDVIKKAYRNRMNSISNTISTFYSNVVMKKGEFPYLNHNYYCAEGDNVWRIGGHTDENWPLGFFLSCSASSKSDVYAEGVTVMAYMRYDEVKKWENTFNTVTEEEDRGEDYERFKKEKAEKLFDCVEKRFPGFKKAIHSYTSATPLTARDYLGTHDGTLYGYSKDADDAIKSFISPNTKIPNLLLTGQNINLHGVLGVSLSSVVTSSQIFGLEYLIKKIRNA